MTSAAPNLIDGLRAILLETRKISGTPFLRYITQELSRLLGGAYVQVGHLSEDGRRIYADPCAKDGALLAPLEYEVQDTPCAHVVGAHTQYHPDDVASLFPNDAFLLEQGYRGYLGCPIFRSDGRPSGLLSVLSTSPLDLDTADITVLEALAFRAGADVERARAVEAREASEALFREIVDQQTEMVCRFLIDGRLTFANRAYLHTFGFCAEDIGKKPYEPRLHPDDRDLVRNELSRISRERPHVVIENRIFGQDGRVLWTQWTNIGLFDEAGKLVGYQSAGRDITDAKRAEDRLQQLYQELREAHEHKDRFLAMLAHELRNPIGAVLNAIAVLELDPERSPRDARAIAIARRQAVQQSKLLDDLLDVSRITRGKVELNKQPLALFAVVHDVAEARRAALQAKSQELEIDLPDAPSPVLADPVRLEQIIANLLDNASKYTHPGGRIRIEGEVLDGVATVRIIDDGQGIATEMLEKIFELFQQGGQKAAHSTGLGIGLTVVRELLQRHDGWVSAHSDGLGKGSTFTVHLPTLSEPEAASPSERSPERAVAPRSILVVDDNADAADMLAELLRAWGHRVIALHDGSSALQCATEEPPDLALIDIAMPGMDGYTLARKLRSVFPRSTLFLVAVTGFGQPLDIEKSRQACFDEHLTKPVDHRRLHQIIGGLPATPA